MAGGGGAQASRSLTPREPVIAPVSAVLRFVLLERVIPTRGGYAVTDTLTRARIFCAVLLTFQLTTIVLRWRISDRFLKNLTYKIMHITDLLVAVSVTTQSICAVAATALEPSAAIVAYRDAALRIDKLLEPEQPHAADVARIRCRFTWIYVPRVLYLAIELVVWTTIYGIGDTWSHYGDSLCKAISDITMLSYTVRLIELENRTTALERRLRQTAAAVVGKCPSTLTAKTISINRTKIPSLQQSEARECYLLLCEMCAIINNTFAFQVVLGFVRYFILITTVIHQFDAVLKNPKASAAEGSLESMAILPVVIYLCGALQVVFLAALQVGHAANVIRLHRDIVRHAETLAIAGGDEEARMFWSALATLCHRRLLQFTACGFFNVDYSLLVTMFATAVTYTVLLIQMNDSSYHD